MKIRQSRSISRRPLVDIDGSESISEVTISGVPNGATLSAGIDNGDGSWSLTSADLSILSITPPANSNADFDLTIEVATVDGADSATITDTLHIQVGAINDAVTNVNLWGSSVAENSPAGTVVGNLSATDIDTGESFTYDIVDSDGNVVGDANFEIVGDEVRVKAGADLNHEAASSHDLNIRVTDSGGESHTAPFSIDVTDVNETPTVTGESFSIDEDGTVFGNLLDNDSDVDGDVLVVDSYTQPSNGSVTVDPNGDFIYQPVANFSGTDSFTYMVADGNGELVTQTVSIEVAPVADGAMIESDNVSGVHHTQIPLDIAVVFADVAERDNFHQLTIAGVPDGVLLSAGTNQGDGNWSLSLDDLDGLTMTSLRTDSILFDLVVSGTVVDGTDAHSISSVFTVQIVGDDAEPSQPNQTNETDRREQTPNSIPEDGQPIRDLDQISRSLDNLSFSVDQSETFAAFGGGDESPIWQSDQWNQIATSLDSNEAKGDSFDDDDSATTLDELQVDVDSVPDGLPGPSELVGGDPIPLSSDELESVQVQVDGLSHLEELSDGNHHAPLTAGALMLLITSKDESRRKVKKLSSTQTEQKP